MKTASQLATAAALCCVVSSIAAAAQSIPYSSPRIRGRVVTAESGQPLAGVSVLAWWRENREPNSLLFAKTIRAVETQSGPDGGFAFEAWEPKTLVAPVSRESPLLIFFLPGREPTYLQAGHIVPGERSAEIRMLSLPESSPERTKKLTQLMNTVLLVWAPLDGQPTPRIVSAIAADWHSAPEELRSQIPALIPWFEQTLKELRAGSGG